jgi:hypothetical protein
MQTKKRVNGKRSNRRKRERKQTTPNKDQLAGMLQWLLPDDSIFSEIRLHGNTKWVPRCLVYVAILWAWSETACLTDAHVDAVACYRSMFGFMVPGTYQGFMGALTKWTETWMKLLWPLLHQRMREIGGEFWRVGGWVPIAFDGSRSSTPRTQANERTFRAKNYGKGTTAKYRKKKSKGMRRKKNEKNPPQLPKPQAWITMLWHMGLRLPWMWRLGPSNSSERGHVMEMLETGKYPKNTLFCGDAGFVGYPLWSAILQHGGHFLVRVGANVSLLRESADYQQIKKGLVLCWPRAMQSKQPPLRLRLVKIRLGKTGAYLLTNVLDDKKLSKKQMVRFYKMRWGIEVEFRGLKQTLDRAKLRCRNDRRLYVELHWSIMAMAIAELFALKEQLAKRTVKTRSKGSGSAPMKRSLANTMRALRRCMRDRYEVPTSGKDLKTLLREAVTDSYIRKGSKQARYHPPNPDKKPLGKPQVRTLTAAEKKQLRKTTIETTA